MSGPAYLFELTINAGSVESFKEKAAAYTSAVRDKEPGMLEYQWWLTADGSRALLKEAFVDSDAILAHLAHVGPTLPELLAIAPITRFEVFGEVNGAAREALDELGAVYFAHEVGFER